MDKTPLIVVAGPTASGKTGLAIDICKAVNGQVVSADSMQIYKHMDIGTAKPSQQEQDGIVHHLIDIVPPTENFSLADYVNVAHETIAQVHGTGMAPVMAGGTGLYIDTVINNIDLAETEKDEALRQELAAFAAKHGNEALHEKLKQPDPESHARLHPNDVKRVVRALEVLYTSGQTISEHNRASRNRPSPYSALMMGIQWPREELYRRIDLRVDQMMCQGLLQEVETLVAAGLNETHTAMQAIGYKELLQYLAGSISQEEAIEKIKMESRRYAKRQLSWFARHGEMLWFAPDQVEQAVMAAKTFLQQNKG